MLSQPFEKPLRVWVGLGFPRQLNSVVDAYQFVTDWCGNSPEQKAAIRACKAALTGDIDAETARGVVIQFARKKNILVEEDAMPPMAGLRQWLPA
ncbi:DUF982 domain-containing protein [Mesorhizobium sp. Pch-S]|jgi:hypothetical protein|uniref:DUF982 domain-containing protein n=1 Tax=Mesorhizobium sp. Pch-S TaxID=2082387 RepID=UPI001010CAD4|nr:DUF982 domain-containing protein [Mesorhizobium sp. Pch-S]QAZ44141.1 DUF982 domain-containing protein [Mesorhizobium sp. Pch-S]